MYGDVLWMFSETVSKIKAYYKRWEDGTLWEGQVQLGILGQKHKDVKFLTVTEEMFLYILNGLWWIMHDVGVYNLWHISK